MYFKKVVCHDCGHVQFMETDDKRSAFIVCGKCKLYRELAISVPIYAEITQGVKYNPSYYLCDECYGKFSKHIKGFFDEER